MAETATRPARSRAARTSGKASTVAAPKTAEAVVPTADDELVKTTYELINKGRTRNGEGKELNYNLHEAGIARGQIFTGRDVVAVRIQIIRNPNAVIDD